MVKLQHVLDTIRDFADTDPDPVDWEIISDMVEDFLDQRELYFDEEVYLDEDDFAREEDWN